MADEQVWHRRRGHLADHKNGIVRSSIFFCRTSGVNPSDYQAIRGGVEKIILETGRQLTMRDYGNFEQGDGQFCSPDWYQGQAMTGVDKGFGLQASALVLDRLLREEPYQKPNPHFDFMVIDKDMRTAANDSNNNYIFGFGPYPNNIVSTKRFRKWIPDEALRQAALAIIGAHQFGHNLDLVARNYNIGSEGYKKGHCDGDKGPCLMEQVNVSGKRDIASQARLIIDRNDWLCPDCTEEIQLKRDDLRIKGIYW